MKRIRHDVDLRAIVRASPLTQAALARIARCTPAHITNMINGQAVSLSYARPVARALGYGDVSELFEDADSRAKDADSRANVEAVRAA